MSNLTNGASVCLKVKVMDSVHFRQGGCSKYIKNWTSWPGGVTGTFLVHDQDDPDINTWALSVTFDRVRELQLQGLLTAFFPSLLHSLRN